MSSKKDICCECHSHSLQIVASVLLFLSANTILSSVNHFRRHLFPLLYSELMISGTSAV